MKRVLALLLLSGVLYGQTYTLQNAFPNISVQAPVDFQVPNDTTDRIFVVSQAGKIMVFPNAPTASNPKTFLDISDKLIYSGEQGLLGLAFHPNYTVNGYFYVNYVANSPRRTIIARYSVSGSNPDSAVKNSEQILLTFEQPYTNHKGGQLAFGPDGYLYIATGDGGSAGDPNNNGQNKGTLLGKILRIDINNTAPGLAYAIPPDNPFANNAQGWRQEIYTYGMRNPWRFSYDAVSGWWWCADVGQGAWEEIDLLWNGGNYGWRVMEGNHCYNPSSGCDTTGKIPPIWEYAHNASGGYSITGGAVYRGPNVPGLSGKYVYGDYVSKRIWALQYDRVNPTVNSVLIDNSGVGMSAFGIDRYGEMYVLDLSGNRIMKFTPTAAVLAPTRLSATATAPGKVLLIWADNSTNETGFYIERKAGASGIFSVIDSTAANTTAYTDHSVSPTTAYTYRVRAFAGAERSGYSNSAGVLSLLPVALTMFTVTARSGGALLFWRTATETNNAGFTVQRDAGNGWEDLAFLPGAGTATTSHNYTYFDSPANVALGTEVLYRLKQTDYNGAMQVTAAIAFRGLAAPGAFVLFPNYPNPFNPSTTLAYSLPEEAEMALELFTPSGEKAVTLRRGKQAAGTHQVVWHAAGFPTGLYFARLTATGTNSGVFYTQSNKLLLVK